MFWAKGDMWSGLEGRVGVPLVVSKAKRKAWDACVGAGLRGKGGLGWGQAEHVRGCGNTQLLWGPSAV